MHNHGMELNVPSPNGCVALNIKPTKNTIGLLPILHKFVVEQL